MQALVKPLTWILGIVFLLIGVAGFFVTKNMLLVFEVDAVHNIVHILSGVVALYAVSSGMSYARMFLVLFGIVYAVVALIGFAMGGNVLSLFTVNQADNFLHAAIALVCLVVGFGSKSH